MQTRLGNEGMGVKMWGEGREERYNHQTQCRGIVFRISHKSEIHVNNVVRIAVERWSRTHLPFGSIANRISLYNSSQLIV